MEEEDEALVEAEVSVEDSINEDDSSEEEDEAKDCDVKSPEQAVKLKAITPKRRANGILAFCNFMGNSCRFSTTTALYDIGMP